MLMNVVLAVVPEIDIPGHASLAFSLSWIGSKKSEKYTLFHLGMEKPVILIQKRQYH
jgi:phosphoribosyl 1,2-cyclic phosphodiesterase